jgi:prepilin-type N-terminal cleavage/methylation domain-containing protein
MAIVRSPDDRLATATGIRPPAPQAGFTIVELMMSLAVLTVGISGIIAMQKVTAVSNLHSKSVAIATQIANAWQDQLLVEGTLWRRSASPSLPTWAWLTKTDQTGWFRPKYDDTYRHFGAAFDALGNPVTEGNIAQAQFCVHLQLVPVIALTDSLGNATIRASVRVIWPRVQGKQPASFCASDADAKALGDDITDFHSLYQTFAIRVHP